MRGRWRHVQEGRAHGVGGGNLFVVRHASVFEGASATTTFGGEGGASGRELEKVQTFRQNDSSLELEWCMSQIRHLVYTSSPLLKRVEEG